MVGLWRRMSEGAASKEQHNSCTCESFALIHGPYCHEHTRSYCHCEGVTVSRREHGAHEALSASDKYCYGDALLARFVVHRLDVKRADRCTERSVQRKVHIGHWEGGFSRSVHAHVVRGE